MSRRRDKKGGKPQRPRVVYKTPGRECQHADSGCCPACLSPATFHRRFHSRQPMPAAR